MEDENYRKDFERTLGYVQCLEEKITNLERHIYHLQQNDKMKTSVINILEQQNKELKVELESTI